MIFQQAGQRARAHQEVVAEGRDHAHAGELAGGRAGQGRGVGGALANEVRAWCAANGDDKKLRIVLCGHAGEHDALLASGWHTRQWTARKGYAVTDEAVANSASETIWCSPHCVPEVVAQVDLFSAEALA